MPRIDNEKQFEYRRLMSEADVWASLDGCEGGDFLMSLTNLLLQAQSGHGYSYADDNVTADLLAQALRVEMDAHQKGALDYGLDEGWFEPEALAEALVEVEAIRNG